MKHLMIDLETLSTRPTAAIASIAAVAFNIETGETGPEFYCAVDVQSCIDIGMTVDADTIKWWMEQSKEAQSVLFTDKPVRILKALCDLESFFNKLDPDTLVWANPASFDLPILRNAFNQHIRMKDVPWKGKNQRCLHTLSSLFPKIKENTEFIGTRHNALDDCRHQIKYCCKIWSKLLSGQVAIKCLDSLNALM